MEGSSTSDEVSNIQMPLDNINTESRECIREILLIALEEACAFSSERKRKKVWSATPISKRKRHNSLELSRAIAANRSEIDIQLVTSENLEEVLIELNKFDLLQVTANNQLTTVTIPPILEGYLEFVAKEGWTHFPWAKVKWFFKAKMNNVISNLFESLALAQPPGPNMEMFKYVEVKERLFQLLDTFSGVPFTIQRIAELLTYPKRHYKTTEKFMRALEKNLRIVSTMELKSIPVTPAKVPEQTEVIEAIIHASMVKALNLKEQSSSVPTNTNPTADVELNDSLVNTVVPSLDEKIEKKIGETSDLSEVSATACIDEISEKIGSNQSGEKTDVNKISDETNVNEECEKANPHAVGEKIELLVGIEKTNQMEVDKECTDSKPPICGAII